VPPQQIDPLAAQFGGKLLAPTSPPPMPAVDPLAARAIQPPAQSDAVRTAGGDERVHDVHADAPVDDPQIVNCAYADGRVTIRFTNGVTLEEDNVSRALFDAIVATETTVQAFAERHPDWRQHEDAIVAFAESVSPCGIDMLEVLDHVYGLITTGQGLQAERAAMIEKPIDRAAPVRGTDLVAWCAAVLTACRDDTDR
jgi:hypothetical protein